MPTATLTACGGELRNIGPPRQHVRVPAADPIAVLESAKRRFDRLRALLPEREALRNSLVADAHADPLADEDKRLRQERKARGEKNPPVPGWGRRPAIARAIGQSERNVRNLLDAELARREITGQPRRLADPDSAFALLPEAQRAVDEVTRARDAYYEAIADALPPYVRGARPSNAEAERFAEVRAITGLDASHLRRIQRGVREKRAGKTTHP
jgi:hypothetical protein